jgi:hypothetical protein
MLGENFNYLYTPESSKIYEGCTTETRDRS